MGGVRGPARHGETRNRHVRRRGAGARVRPVPDRRCRNFMHQQAEGMAACVPVPRHRAQNTQTGTTHHHGGHHRVRAHDRSHHGVHQRRPLRTRR